MIVSIEKYIGMVLSNLETECKSARYIGWVRDRLRDFCEFKLCHPSESIESPYSPGTLRVDLAEFYASSPPAVHRWRE